MSQEMTRDKDEKDFQAFWTQPRWEIPLWHKTQTVKLDKTNCKHDQSHYKTQFKHIEH